MKQNPEIEELIAAAQRMEEDKLRQRKLSDMIDRLAAEEAATADIDTDTKGKIRPLWRWTSIAASILIIGLLGTRLMFHNNEVPLVAENHGTATAKSVPNGVNSVVPTDESTDTQPNTATTTFERTTAIYNKPATTNNNLLAINETTDAETPDMESPTTENFEREEIKSESLIAENTMAENETTSNEVTEKRVFQRTSTRLAARKSEWTKPRRASKPRRESNTLLAFSNGGTGMEFVIIEN